MTEPTPQAARWPNTPEGDYARMLAWNRGDPEALAAVPEAAARPERPVTVPGVEDLVTWLRAQLDADEQHLGHRLALCDDPGNHIPPRRLIAELDAKRRILDRPDRAVDHPPHREDYTSAHALDDVVRLLALPYAGRPGYREEWHPDRAT